MNIKEYQIIIKECETLAIEKNKLYGDKNIIRYGTLGVLMRMQDKIERAFNLIKREVENDVSFDESLEDTFKDLVNYSTYNIMLLRKKFEGDK
jgi:hypothetical protein